MLNPDDYRLTAYALGELEPEDLAEVEAALKDSPELQKVVEDIRQADKLVAQALHAEPNAQLHSSQRDAIYAAAISGNEEEAAAAEGLDESELPEPIEVTVSKPSGRSRWLLYSTVAALFLAVTLLVAWQTEHLPTGEPVYQSSAWLRMEEIYVVHSAQSREMIDPSVTDEELLARSSYSKEPPVESLGANSLNADQIRGHSLLNDLHGNHAEGSRIVKSKGPGQGFVGAKLPDAPSYYWTREEGWFETIDGETSKSNGPSQEFVGANMADGSAANSGGNFPARYGPVEPLDDARVMADESTLVQPIGQLYTRITSKEVEQELLKARTQAMEEQFNSHELNVDEDFIETAALGNEQVRRLTEKAMIQRQRLSQLSEAGAEGTNDPRYQEQLQQNLETERKRNELLDNLRDDIRTERMTEGEEKRKEVLQKAKNRIASNQMEIDLLREKFFTQRDALKGKSQEGLELAYKAEELQREESVVEMISSRIMRLRTEVQGPAKVTLLRKAEPAKKKVRMEPPSDTPSEPMPRDLRMQIALLRSPLVLERVLDRPDVANHPIVQEQEDPQKWLKEHMSVQARGSSELFIVNFGSPDPQLSATVVNAIVESYFRMHTQDEAQRGTRVVDLLEDERARRSTKIQQLRDQLKEMEARTIGKSTTRKQSPKKSETKQSTPKQTENKQTEDKQSENKPPKSWRRVKAVPNASRLLVGDRDELPLEGMQANVRVDGFRARVIVDYYFYNDRSSRLEGTFKLRLPDDASLYYFAFGETSMEYRPQADQLVSAGFIPPELLRSSGTQPKDIFHVRSRSWDKVKEARIVPRVKAAHAYGETVRRKIDPALVEWAGAGVFNARVFPLGPKKLHRIVVGYDVNLTADGDALMYKFQLPEDVPQSVVDVDLAAIPGVHAEVSPSTRAFTSGGRAYYHITSPSDQFVGVRLEGASDLVLTGRDENQQDYFTTRVTPKLNSQERTNQVDSAVFLVDTSLSSQPDKFNVWLKLMETTLNENRENMKEFSTLFFGIDSHWWQPKYVANTPENVQALMDYCQTLSLEGATDLNAALAEATSPHWEKGNRKKPRQRDFFLYSDGAATWGDTRLTSRTLTDLKSSGGALFAFKTGFGGTATDALESLVRATGGTVISVADEKEIEKAATAHRQRPWEFEGITVEGGQDLLIAGRPETIYAGQPLTIVGRGTPPANAELKLKLRRGQETKTVQVPLGEQVSSELTARAYGQVAVGQLEELSQTTEDLSVAYARHFRVTGQTCSLLMLESEADYRRFNIKPEEDAQVVRNSRVSERISAELAKLQETLQDSKQALLAWLVQLKDVPGVKFHTPAELTSLLDKLSVESFEMPRERFVCKQHTDKAWPTPFRSALQKEALASSSLRQEAERRHATLGASDALKALSSLIERSPGDTSLSREVAFAAMQWELPAQAYPLLKRVVEARPYEPQTYLALAQCAMAANRAELAILYYEIVLSGSWNSRYGDLRRIVGIEYQELLRSIIAGNNDSQASAYALDRLKSIQSTASLKHADLIITAQWSTDKTDLDLHVIEPSGERCYYSHTQTKSGGKLTTDVTAGFGPEMYTIAQARPGTYKVQMHFYRGDTNRTQTESTVYLTVYRNFGGPEMKVERHAVTLRDVKDKRDVLTIKIPENGSTKK